MHLSVTGKQLDVGDALRIHVENSLQNSVGKYFDSAIEASVVFSRVAHLYRTDISVHVGRGILVQSHAEESEPYPAFDAASERIAKRLRRYKRRLRGHHKGNRGKTSSARQEMPAAGPAQPGDKEEEDEQSVVAAEAATGVSALTVGEAVARPNLDALPALMFRNSVDGGLKVVSLRCDGDVGWADPQGGRPEPQ